ncbi:MAG: hypothetical protein ABFD66_04765 [Smithella sp.]
MHELDLEKLRRFSLVVALILLTYSLAGIKMIPDANICFSGLPFKVSRPGLLPIGLIIASLCAIGRFYYYGFMLKKSPYRVRRDILDSMDLRYNKVKKVPTYIGSIEFKTNISRPDRESAEKYVSDFPDAFPKVAGARPSMKIKSSEFIGEDGDNYISYDVNIVIPALCIHAAIFQDIDYSSPIWLNLASLIIFIIFQIVLKG